MNWALCSAAAFVTAGALLTIGTVGKPRKPITPGVAAFSALFSAGLIVLLILAALRLS